MEVMQKAWEEVGEQGEMRADVGRDKITQGLKIQAQDLGFLSLTALNSMVELRACEGESRDKLWEKKITLAAAFWIYGRGKRQKEGYQE